MNCLVFRQERKTSILWHIFMQMPLCKKMKCKNAAVLYIPVPLLWMYLLCTVKAGVGRIGETSKNKLLKLKKALQVSAKPLLQNTLTSTAWLHWLPRSFTWEIRVNSEFAPDHLFSSDPGSAFWSGQWSGGGFHTCDFVSDQTEMSESLDQTG